MHLEANLKSLIKASHPGRGLPQFLEPWQGRRRINQVAKARSIAQLDLHSLCLHKWQKSHLRVEYLGKALLVVHNHSKISSSPKQIRLFRKDRKVGRDQLKNYLQLCNRNLALQSLAQASITKYPREIKSHLASE